MTELWSTMSISLHWAAALWNMLSIHSVYLNEGQEVNWYLSCFLPKADEKDDEVMLIDNALMKSLEQFLDIG